jgi:predicted TIM-barrel fold metal-dependent hydrolase
MEKTMSSAHRIDVHQHVVPPFYAQALASHGGDPSGSVTPDWSPERALDFMDSQQIATGILSVSTPSVVGWAQSERRQMARRINEYTADLVAGQPGRFGSFATLPLPDVGGAVEELGHALDTLHADGVVLMASYAGKYLGDPAFEPLWAELDRRHAVVFEHPGDTPGQPPLPPAAGVAPPMIDFPFETTRTGVQLVLNGVLDRYPQVRVILSHAGGFLPYASLRFAELARVFQHDAPSPDAILASFRSFYFDTALSAGPTLPTLKAFAGPGHILFGTDSPYDHGVSAAFTAALDADNSLTADDQAAISHRNAQALFPRLAPHPVTSPEQRSS